MNKKLIVNGEDLEFQYEMKQNFVQLNINEQIFKIEMLNEDTFKLNGKNYKVHAVNDFFSINGEQFHIKNFERKLKSNKSADLGEMVSPMPGKILKVLVSIGDEVKKGDKLIVMEAMKMEHTIKASKDGKIEKIYFEQDQLVDGGVELVELN